MEAKKGDIEGEKLETSQEAPKENEEVEVDSSKTKKGYENHTEF